MDNPITNESWLNTPPFVPISPQVTNNFPIAPTFSTERLTIIEGSWLGDFVRNMNSPFLNQKNTIQVTQSTPYPSFPIVYTTPNGILLNNIYAPGTTTSSYVAPVYIASVNSVFGRSGSIIGQLGDYTTSLITEGTNYYFTDIRAQNALSGAMSTLSSNIASTSASL